MVPVQKNKTYNEIMYNELMFIDMRKNKTYNSVNAFLA